MITSMWKRKWYRTLVVFVAASAIGVYLEVVPRLYDLMALAQDIDRARDRLTQAESADAQIQAITQKRSSIQQELAHLPANAGSNAQTLLQSIQTAVNSSGVQMVSLRPVQAQPSAELTETSFELQVEGGFHRQAAMVNALELAQPLVTFASIQLDSDGLIASTLVGRYQIRFMTIPRM